MPDAEFPFPNLFDPDLFERRFGCGISPRVAPPRSIREALDAVHQPDPVECLYPIEPFPEFEKRLGRRRDYCLRRDATLGTQGEIDMRLRISDMARQARLDSISWGRMQVQRRVWTRSGFRERLTFFWGDHFTALGKNGVSLRGMAPYLETAIRPHLGGLFEDILIAAVLHPLMLEYLDQRFSIGPNSKGARTGVGATRGMNENLAREVLELHTLGVDGPYDQSDVRELARLLAGVTSSAVHGFQYLPFNSDPGLKTVLGIPYGRSGPGELGDVVKALRDLAIHPATAGHLSRKLALHFLGSQGGDDIVACMTDRYLETRGNLTAVYAAMLSHPNAWSPAAVKVKTPVDFVASCLRALAPDPRVSMAFSRRFFRTRVLEPIGLMGMPWERPAGPDGWPEQAEAWISPQALAARLQWAFSVPAQLQPDIPETPGLLRAAFGARPVSARLRSALSKAQSGWERAGLVFASPEFQLA